MKGVTACHCSPLLLSACSSCCCCLPACLPGQQSAAKACSAVAHCLPASGAAAPPPLQAGSTCTFVSRDAGLTWEDVADYVGECGGSE